MKNPELFHKTVGILVKAYFDDTLDHSICGCAVGNLICANMKMFYPYWINVFCTTRAYGSDFNINNYFGDAKEQIDSTGYDPYSLSLIEKAFENGDSERINIYSGLMSVIDTLMLIHEATEQEAQQAKELFTLTA